MLRGLILSLALGAGSLHQLLSEEGWGNVTEGKGIAAWLQKEPSEVELAVALGQMKLRKASI